MKVVAHSRLFIVDQDVGYNNICIGYLQVMNVWAMISRNYVYWDAVG